MSDMKPQVYKDDRPAEYFDQFHAAARKGVGWTYPFVRAIVSLPTLLLYRTRAIGVKNVPKSGPLILAPNHFSQMDHFFTGLYLRRQIRFMAKSQIFGPPVLTYVYKHGGVFPVRRGHHDEEAFKTAFTILDQEEMLLIYAEGGRSRPASSASRNRAIGRLALESGRAGRPGRDPRLRLGAALEALPLPEGDGPVRRAASPSRSRSRPTASASSRSRPRSSTGSGRCTRCSRSTAAAT